MKINKRESLKIKYAELFVMSSPRASCSSTLGQFSLQTLSAGLSFLQR